VGVGAVVLALGLQAGERDGDASELLHVEVERKSKKEVEGNQIQD
jgi:hypothetical protein